MTRDEVFALCKEIAPEFGYDPVMILAQIEQESSYDHRAARLEQGYFRKYVLHHPELAKKGVPLKIMLASSYGLGQLMGLSLVELGWLAPIDSVRVAASLDAYIANPRVQVQTMCTWMNVKQDLGDSHTINDALRRYNGSAEYPPLVWARWDKLKEVYK